MTKRERKHIHAKTRAQFRDLDCELRRIGVKSLDTILLTPGSGMIDTPFLQGILSVLELKGIKGVDILLLPKGTELNTISPEKFQSLAEAKGFSKIQDNLDAEHQSSSAAGNGDCGARAPEALQAEPRPAQDEPEPAPRLCGDEAQGPAEEEGFRTVAVKRLPRGFGLSRKDNSHA